MEEINLPIHKTIEKAEKTVTIPEAKLIVLLDRIKEYEENETILADGCFKAMQAIGLVDPTTNKLFTEVKEGKNIFGRIIKHIKSEISFTDYFMNKEKFENDLTDKFNFLKPILEIGQKYADRKHG